MPIEPENIRVSFGMPIRLTDAPKQPRTTLSYEETCRLERIVTAKRDNPAQHDGNTVATLARHKAWVDALRAAFGASTFTSAQAAPVWGLEVATASNRLTNLLTKGKVAREEKDRGRGVVSKWMVVE